ncbi:MAG: ABC transporter permease [Beijerinckiaceae bacterium]|nr:ABC transporter permease [Beijerinckiaceae bacterium]
MPHPTPASALPSEVRSPGLDWRQLRKRLKPWLQFKVLAGGGVLLLFFLASIFAEWVSPFDPNRQNLMKAMTPPEYFFGPHFFGTDHVGRDILSRCIFGARVSLAIALAVVVISGAVGVLLGVISGYFGRFVDFGIQKVVEVMWAFPPLLLAIAVLAFLGQGLSILIMALTLQRWIPFCRVTRANALTLKEREFVTAARSLGATHTRIIFKHLLPNLMQSALVIGTFAMASAIIAEAALSFLGLGVPPVIPTWGGMLADGRTYISTSWWMALFPGLCIFVTVLAINMLGDALRDNLDPKLKRSGGRA